MSEETVRPNWTAQYTLKKRSLNTEVYRKPTQPGQYLLLDSHHRLELKLGVIRTLNHRAETKPTKSEGREKEQKPIRGALQNCGYPNWTSVKTS